MQSVSMVFCLVSLSAYIHLCHDLNMSLNSNMMYGCVSAPFDAYVIAQTGSELLCLHLYDKGMYTDASFMSFKREFVIGKQLLL